MLPFIHQRSTSALPHRSQQRRQRGSPSTPSVQLGSTSPAQETPSTQFGSTKEAGDASQATSGTAPNGATCPSWDGIGSCACAVRGRLSTTAATSRIEFDFMGRAHLREKIAPVATSESTGRNRKIKTIALNRKGFAIAAACRPSPVYLIAANPRGPSAESAYLPRSLYFGR